MKKTSQLLLLLILSFNSFAGKVAYLSINELKQSDINLLPVSSEKKMKVIDLESGTVLKNIEFAANISQVFTSNDSRSIYIAQQPTNTLYKLDAKTLTITKRWDNLPTSIKHMVLSPDNKQLYFSGYLENKIYSLDFDTDVIQEAYDNNSPISDLLYNQTLDTLVLFAGSNTNNIKVTTLDSISMTVQNEFFIPTPTTSPTTSYAYLNKRGTTLYVFHGYSYRVIHSYDMATGNKKWDFRNGNRFSKFGYESNGEVILFSGQKTLKLNATDGQVADEIDMHVLFSSNQRVIIEEQYQFTKIYRSISNSDKYHSRRF